jgi:hypothetical protein
MSLPGYKILWKSHAKVPDIVEKGIDSCKSAVYHEVLHLGYGMGPIQDIVGSEAQEHTP